MLVATLAATWIVNQPKRLPDLPRPASTLRIKEWSVELPLSSTVADAYYTYDSSNDEVFISTKQLDALLSQIHGCTGGLHGLYFKKTTSPLHLAEQLHAAPLCAVPASSETEQIGTIQTGIRAAAQAVIAD